MSVEDKKKETAPMENLALEVEEIEFNQGTVIIGQIDSVLVDSLNKRGPCSEKPCYAMVSVQKVLSRGNDEASRIKEEVVVMHFAFTLGPTTEKDFPNLNSPLPGLSVGEQFQAKLRARMMGDSEISFTVFQYNKLTN